MSDRITFRNARVKALILAATCGIILHCSVCESVFGQSLFLVHNGPLKLGSPKIPNKVIIFRVDDTAKTLETVYGPIPDTATWSQIWNIDVYSGDGPVVIAEGDWFPTKLYVLYPSAVTHAEIIDFKSYGTIMRYWYFRGNGKMDEIQIQYSINPLTKTAMPSMKRLLLETPTRQYKSEYPYDIQELRLTGGESEYGGGGKSDVVSLRMKADGVIEPKGIDINLNGNAVPDSIIRMKSSFGWTLIANEPTYRALLSVPERNGLTQRELLIYHRDSGIWNSIMLEGAETTLRVINGWLAGIIADCHPKTNYEIRKGEPPVLREDAVIIDPERNNAFVVHLGKEGEILWIESGSVYYRVGQDLYRARIEGNGFVDRTLLLSDFRLHFIHWAFRGSEGGK